MQAAWLQGKWENGIQRVLLSQTREVTHVLCSLRDPAEMIGFSQECGPDRTIDPMP